MKPKLEIELVPSTSWYSNLRKILDNADWDKIRKQMYRLANYRCEICSGKGESHPVECHEVWEYDNVNYVQSLAFCQAICPLCHEAKHIGLAQIKGNGERAKDTLKRVNGWDDEQVEDYIGDKFVEWKERSEHQWKLNIDKIADYGIDLNKYKHKLNK